MGPTEPSQLIPLSGHDVHVWFLDPEQVSREEAGECFERLLCEEERVRCLRFVFDRDKHTFLVARSLLRRVLSRYQLAPPESWQFQVNAYGKPSIHPPPDGGGIQFNITHTRGLVALAIARGRPVGIDAEHIERTIEWQQLVRDVLAEREATFLESLPDPERTRGFYRFWTLKEAYIKGCGKGLSIPLKSFWFELAAGSSPRIQFADPLPRRRETWSFWLSDQFPKHELALGVVGPGSAVPTFHPGSGLF